jgi:hypothetical protein
VYWPQPRWRRAAGVRQRMAVLFGGPHTSEPSFRRATVQPGDLLYPIGVCDQVLYVLGRISVSEIVQVGDDQGGDSWPLPAPPRSSSAPREPASCLTARCRARFCGGSLTGRGGDHGRSGTSAATGACSTPSACRASTGWPSPPPLTWKPSSPDRRARRSPLSRSRKHRENARRHRPAFLTGYGNTAPLPDPRQKRTVAPRAPVHEYTDRPLARRPFPGGPTTRSPVDNRTRTRRSGTSDGPWPRHCAGQFCASRTALTPALRPRTRDSPWRGKGRRVPFRTPMSARKVIDHKRSADRPPVSGVEQLPVPFGDDLNGAVDHFDGRLIVYCVRRHR